MSERISYRREGDRLYGKCRRCNFEWFFKIYPEDKVWSLKRTLGFFLEDCCEYAKK